MDVKHRHIVTGGIQEFLFFCNQVGKKPAWFNPILNQRDVERIPTGSTVILYGDFVKSRIYPLIQQAWDAGLIQTQVITPNEVTAKHD